MWPPQYNSESSTVSGFSSSSDLTTSPHSISNSSSFLYVMSPEQRVPQFENKTISDINHANGVKKPFLKILEQPVDQFRFRYKSEMSGTHGCLIGRSTKKSFPTVKLQNYDGEALVACTLVQVDETHNTHPHRLVVYNNSEEIDDPHIITVSRKTGFKASFRGLSILYTSKKMIVEELVKKHKVNFPNSNSDENLRMEYENVAKNINMNSVCLKFSVYDKNHMQICDSVYSESIDNTKCAETCQLKIVKMSKASGSCLGNELIMLFVEKVNKKNIKVRFFELKNNVRVWEDFAMFSEFDVHHQYGISVMTPPYKDRRVQHDVDVFVELYRPKDKAVSPKMPFCYKALLRNFKRLRTDDDYVETNLHSKEPAASLPVTVEDINQTELYHKSSTLDQLNIESNNQSMNIAMYAQPLETFNYVQTMPSTIFDNTPLVNDDIEYMNLNRCNMEDFFDINIDPIELKQIMNELSNPEPSSIHKGESFLVDDYLQTDSVTTNQTENVQKNKMKLSELSKRYSNESISIFKQFLLLMRRGENLSKRDIYMMCRLTEKELSHHDNLIHLFVYSNCEILLKKILRILNAIYSSKISEILDKTNEDGLTPLHMATYGSQHNCVKLLLTGGCNPNIQEEERGFACCHLAVDCDDEKCLMLLSRYSSQQYALNFNIYNDAGFMPVHLAAKNGSLPLLVCLKNAGAPLHVKTRSDGKNILHLAVQYGHLSLIKHLVKNFKVDPNEITFKGYTALHLACDLEGNQVEDIVTVLLENKADPLKECGSNSSPWKYALKNKKQNIIKIMENYVEKSTVTGSVMFDSEDSHSESSTESSDDESSSTACNEFLDSETLKTVVKSLDETKKWEDIIRVMNLKAILPFCEMSSSPSMIVFNQLEIVEQFSLQNFYEVLLEVKADAALEILKNKYKDLSESFADI